MSGIPSSFTESDFLYFVIPAGVGLTAACIAYIYCFRFRRRSRQQSSDQGVGRTPQVEDSAREGGRSSSSQRGTSEGQARFNLENRHFPSNSSALHTQGVTEISTSNPLLTTPTDAPPSYLRVTQRYRPRSPSPLMFSISATPLSTGGVAATYTLPPSYSEAIKQHEDSEL